MKDHAHLSLVLMLLCQPLFHLHSEVQGYLEDVSVVLAHEPYQLVHILPHQCLLPAWPENNQTEFIQ